MADFSHLGIFRTQAVRVAGYMRRAPVEHPNDVCQGKGLFEFSSPDQVDRMNPARHVSSLLFEESMSNNDSC